MREYLKEYWTTEKGREVICRAMRKYNNSAKGKATRQRYILTDRGKSAVKKAVRNYMQSEKGKETRRRWLKRR